MTRTTRTARAMAMVAGLALTAAACGSGSGDSGGGSGSDTGKAVDGGTLTFLTLQDQFQHLDPQRNYTGEDLAFVNGYLQRTLDGVQVQPGRRERPPS